ncbi:MAG TPA: S53 family peptidase [Solirubrobacterales bacterium]|nr:S53 family peptidase [Solirubrobacterales bacterium]
MKRLGLPLLLCFALLCLALPAAAGAAKKGVIGLGEKRVEALIELHHPRGLNHFVRAVSDPSSPRYRDYASVEQLVNRFGAKEKTQRKVLSWLAARGVRGEVSPTGMQVFATLSRRQAGALRPATARASAAAGVSARVPAALRSAVARVALLSTRTAATHHVGATEAGIEAGEAGSAGAAKPGEPYRSILPHSGTAAGCAEGSSGGIEPGLEPFTPNQYLTAYGHAALHARGLTGKGQKVALVETGGFKHSDIVTFGRCFGFKPPPIKVVPVKVGKPLPAEDETTLDLSMLTVGAPGLEKIYVYEGPESLGGVALTAGTALGTPGHRPDVISISLGFCEPELAGNLALRNAFDNVFAVAAGAGISVLVSAGDQGSSGCRAKDGKTGETTALPMTTVSLPASSPYVTAVGGTNLALSRKNRIKAEVVWNDSVLTPWGGGGGSSLISPRTPWWQAGIDRYGPGRKVPDIAALADLIPGYALYCTAVPSCLSPGQKASGWTSVGGTSAAAPLMAAGVALANQYAAGRGQRDLGFLNPLLYQLGAKGKARAGAFTDVVTGNNDLGRALPPEAGGGKPLGCCQAKTGYDWASGWGSLKLPGFARLAAAADR